MNILLSVVGAILMAAITANESIMSLLLAVALWLTGLSLGYSIAKTDPGQKKP